MNATTPLSTLLSYAYTLGAAGNRTAVTELSGRTVNYTYDGYLSVFRDLASPNPEHYNVPMLAMFKKPINETEPGDLIKPEGTGVKVWWTPLSGDPNGHLHYSLDYPGGRYDQGDIPRDLNEHAKGLGLQRGEFRDPYKDLK